MVSDNTKRGDSLQKEKRSHGVQMNGVIRALKLLEVLRDYTDREHKLTQQEVLKRMQEIDGCCTEKTLRADLRNLMAVLNPVVEEYEQRKEEFRIVYDGMEQGRHRMSGIQYLHEFSNQELEYLIELLKSGTDISREQRSELENKLKRLGSRYYQYNTDSVGGVPQFSTIDKTCLKENLDTIKKAISFNRKVSFVFNGYNREGKLIPVRERRYLVSPYYVLLYGMKYYLLANTGNYENVSIYRLDLMTGIQMEEEVRKNIRKVRELEYGSVTDYVEKHLNMNYDRPVTVTLKVRRNGYTALHDCFGDHFLYKRPIDNEHDEVEVVCSAHAIMDWAIQFSDRVEIIRPFSIRQKILEKAEELSRKYSQSYRKDLL